MSIEQGLGRIPSQESGEKKDSQQEAVDRAFELWTSVYDDPDPDMDEPVHAIEVLIEGALSRKLGEKYTLSREGEFSLARRERERQDGLEFDPKEELAVMWEKEVDIPTGRITITYSVNEAMRDHQMYNQTFFDKPLFNNERVEFTASPETVKNVYKKFEMEYSKKSEEYERKSKEFEVLAAWAAKHKGKRFGAEAWDDLPLLGELWPWVKGATCELVHLPSVNGVEELQLVIYDGEEVRDIVAQVKPKKPKPL